MSHFIPLQSTTYASAKPDRVLLAHIVRVSDNANLRVSGVAGTALSPPFAACYPVAAGTLGVDCEGQAEEGGGGDHPIHGGVAVLVNMDVLDVLVV